MPRSENSDNPVMNTTAIAITPNISGINRRVIIKLVPKRKARLITCPTTDHVPARKKRCLKEGEFTDDIENQKWICVILKSHIQLSASDFPAGLLESAVHEARGSTLSME